MKKFLYSLFLLFFSLQGSGQCSFSVSTVLTHVTCFNGTTGSIVVHVSGGVAPYQYQLAEAGAGAWQSSNTFIALTASTYPVSVKDATGCVKTIYVTINQPAALVANYIATDATCSGSNNGSIIINTSGGTSPYAYNWTKNGAAFSTNQNLSGLSPGNYLLTVTDANGCSTSPIITTQVKPVSLTGFNQDVIANGTGASTASTSQPLDDHNFVFFAQGYNNGSTTGANGLPATGTFNSVQSSARPYQLASYTGNNSLVLTTTPTTYGSVNSGTLSFGAPYRSPYATLYVLATTGNGTGTLNYTVNYADASTSTGALSFPDWFLASATSSTIRAIGGLDRVSWANPGAFETGTNFNLFEAPISIPGASQSKVVNSVNFTWSASGTARVNVFGITGYTSTSSGIRINDGAAVNVTPSVTVTSDAPSNIFCSGQAVTFTAYPVNGGLSPAYQWKKNGVNIPGATAPVYTTSGLANNDKISVQLTSSLSCVTASTGTSPVVTMLLGTVPASVGISSSGSSICSGSTASFTASPVNGGVSPGYQWLLNGNNIPGATLSTYSSPTLANADQVSLRMTSSVGCATGSPASSNSITMNVMPLAEPTVSISSVPNVTFSSVITNGGSTPAYQWYKNGMAIPGATSSTYYTASAGLGNIYSLKLTSSYVCKTVPSAMSNYITVTFATLPVTWELFTAKRNLERAVLTWKLADEQPVINYLVQRSVNGNDFVTIAEIPMQGAGTYTYADLPVTSGIVSYRIGSVENNGSITYSEVRRVQFPKSVQWVLSGTGNYWELKCNVAVSYLLTDETGRKIEAGKVSDGIKVIQKPIAGNLFFLTVYTAGFTETTKLIR